MPSSASGTVSDCARVGGLGARTTPAPPPAALAWKPNSPTVVGGPKTGRPCESTPGAATSATMVIG